MGLKIEAFFSDPRGSQGTALAALLDEIAREYGEEVELITYEGRTGKFNEYHLTSTPAVVVEELIKMVGFCPSKESLLAALREMGLE